MKKFFSLVLALVMALSLTTVAWGEGAISTQDAFDAAIAAGETNITLGASEFTMPAAKGKTLTITGTTGTVINVVPAGQGEAGGQLDYSLDGSNVTFNNVTIKTNSKTYAGYARLSATYNNCVIQNTYNLGVGTSEFNNCVFNITNEYLRVNGAYSAVFNGCTFNTDGRAILVFQDGTKNAQTVTVKDCTFNATTAAYTWNSIHVAAVSIDGSQGGTYAVNLEGTNTVDSDFNGLWQIKASNENVAVTASTDTTTKLETLVPDPEAASTVIDVSDSATTTTVEMSAAAADEVFTNAKPVEIVTADASITFSKEAAGTIGTNAGSSAVTLTVDVEEAPAVADVEPANTAAYNEVMANADADNAVLLSIELTNANGAELFSDSTPNAGTATVKVKLPAGLNTAKLYYLNGADAEYLGEYTADANGYISVELEHFSEYVIVGGTRTVVSGNTGNANGSYSSSTVNGTTTTASVADKYVIYPAGATNVLTNVNTNAFVVKSYTSLSTWTVVSNGVTTQSYIPAYYTLTDGTKLYEADENCGEYRLFKDGVFVTYLNDLNGAIGSGNYVDGDFIADAATYVAKSKGCDTYNVDVYMLNGKVPTMVNKDGWNVAVINGKVAVYSNLPAGSYTAHTFTDEVTYKSTTDLTVVAIECDKCEKSFQVVKTSKLPATYKGATAPLFFGGNNYYILLESAAVSGNTGVVGGTTTGKVESAETFDAGIAMYVGMSVMAAAGSAVVLKKRED